MKTLCLGILAVLMLVTGGAACDSGWQYIGRPPSDFISAVEDPANPNSVLVGTYWNWQEPETGGVYRHYDPDTTWHYAGLVGHRVFQLRNSPYCRSLGVFASTNDGLYYFEEDTSWMLLSRADGAKHLQLSGTTRYHVKR